jgi:hypothetical protein
VLSWPLTRRERLDVFEGFRVRRAQPIRWSSVFHFFVDLW